MARQKILIVDDEETTATDLEKRLTEMGYDVVGKALTGEQALERAREKSPDIVLLDISLAGSPDSATTARMLREIRKIPVICISEDAPGPGKDGASDWTIKRSDDRELGRTVGMALEKHIAQTALALCEAKFRNLVDGAGTGIATIDLEGNFTYVNRALCELSGYGEQDLLGKSFADFLSPEDLEKILGVFGRRLTADDKTPRLEFRFIRKDGTTRVCDSITTVIMHDDEMTGFNAILTDITERKNAESALVLRDERLESLNTLGQMTDAPEAKLLDFAIEECVRFTHSTVAYFHIYEEKTGTIESFKWSREVIRLCSAQKGKRYPLETAGIWADSIRLRKPVIHNDYPTAPGRKGYPRGHFPVLRHLSVPVFDDGKIVAVMGVGNKESNYNESDVSQLVLYLNSVWTMVKQKRAEIALRDREERLRLIVENSQDVIVTATPGGEVTYVSPQVARWGWKPEDIVGKTMMALVHPQDRERVFKEFLDAVSDGRVFSNEFRTVTADGQTRYIDDIGSFIWRDGEVVENIGVLRDITDRKMAEQEKRALGRQKARSEVLSFIVSALPAIGSLVPPEVRTKMVQHFAERFEQNVRPLFEKEMRATTGDCAEPDIVTDSYRAWLAGWLANLGINLKSDNDGPGNRFGFLNCPWEDDARDNPLFCQLCRAMLARSYSWTSCAGTVEQVSSRAAGERECRFEIGM